VSELLRLLPVPAERELPPAAFERRKAALVRSVEAELRAAAHTRRRLARLRSLLGTFFAVVVLGSAVLLATQARTDSTRVLVGVTVVAGSAPLVASLGVPLRGTAAFAR